jgi:uncharacterized protein HemX
MNLEPIVLLGIACVLAGLVVAFLFLVRRRAARRRTRLAQATHDLEATVAQLRNETDSRIAELEEAVNKLKIECVSANVQLVSLKAQTDETLATLKAVSSGQEDTWIRGVVDISIVPRAIESAGSDTWVRAESDPEAVGPTNNVAPFATAISEGKRASTR